MSTKDQNKRSEATTDKDELNQGRNKETANGTLRGGKDASAKGASSKGASSKVASSKGASSKSSSSKGASDEDIKSKQASDEDTSDKDQSGEEIVSRSPRGTRVGPAVIAGYLKGLEAHMQNLNATLNNMSRQLGRTGGNMQFSMQGHSNGQPFRISSQGVSFQGGGTREGSRNSRGERGQVPKKQNRAQGRVEKK